VTTKIKVGDKLYGIYWSHPKWIVAKRVETVRAINTYNILLGWHKGQKGMEGTFYERKDLFRTRSEAQSECDKRNKGGRK